MTGGLGLLGLTRGLGVLARAVSLHVGLGTVGF